MEKNNRHMLVCASFRAQGTPQGTCHKKGSLSLLQYLETELADRGMADVIVTATGCLKACDRGPIMVVYPEGTWYAGVEGEDQIDEILDAMQENGVAQSLLLK
jgi:(2Fe-2S) ferredoxin